MAKNAIHEAVEEVKLFIERRLVERTDLFDFSEG